MTESMSLKQIRARVRNKTGQIHLPDRIYRLIQEHNPMVLETLDYQVESVGNDTTGLVCLQCGNRAATGGLFVMTDYFPLQVFFDERGQLQFKVDTHAVIDRLTEILESQDEQMFQVWGDNMLSTRYAMYFQCVNCLDRYLPHTVLRAVDALESCLDDDCAGCYLCNNPRSREQVYQRCRRCFLPRTAKTTEDLREECRRIGCPNQFMSDVVYGIKLEEL